MIRLKSRGPVLVLATLLASVGAPMVTCQEARGDRKEDAHLASERGDRAFSKADYDKALAEYQTSYAKYAKPYLLFRIGECQRLLKHSSDAFKSYSAYVAKTKQGADRKKAQKYMAELAPTAASGSSTQPPVEARPVVQAADPEAPPMTAEELAKKRIEDEKRAKKLKAAEPVITTKTAPRTEVLPPGYDAVNLLPDPEDIAREKAKPKPLYKKWWLWTAVGGVVVVGVAVGVGLAFGLPKFTSELPIGGPGASALKVAF